MGKVAKHLCPRYACFLCYTDRFNGIAMVKVRFEGRVLPDGLRMTIRAHPTLRVQEQESGFTADYTVTIEDGEIVVDCELEHYDEQAQVALLVRALDIANASVTLKAFSIGASATVLFDTCTDPHGNVTHLVMRDRELAALCKSFSADTDDFDKVLEVVFSDLRLSAAFRDLTDALGIPHLIPLNCARAVETLRTLITPTGADRKKGWSLLQEHLRLSAGYVKTITDHGVGPRHGDSQYVSGGMNRIIATRTWIIIDRFLEYKKRGSVPLPETEFPLLTA